MWPFEMHLMIVIMLLLSTDTENSLQGSFFTGQNNTVLFIAKMRQLCINTGCHIPMYSIQQKQKETNKTLKAPQNIVNK